MRYTVMTVVESLCEDWVSCDGYDFDGEGIACACSDSEIGRIPEVFDKILLIFVTHIAGISKASGSDQLLPFWNHANEIFCER